MKQEQNETLAQVRKTNALIESTQDLSDFYTEKQTEISKAMTEIQESNGHKIKMVNKRIDFNQKTMKRLNTMLPLYSDEAGDNLKESELYSYVVREAVNNLFGGAFKEKLM